ncbi:ArsA-related P-loop ATPase [Streptomyces flavofungini]|uniref:SLAC1 family transporter n=1 Tax=Streptomyces flavofungini TaxID=68200 RepID=UPI003F801441
MRTLLVTGPGGSGRTTVAAAAALASARAGQRVLVLSADRGDTLGAALGGPEAHPGLTARHLTPDARFRDDLVALQERAASAFELLGADRIDGEELTPLPGGEELALLRALRDAARGTAHDTVVVDLPPAPRALAVLALPEQLRRYLRRLLPPERQAARALRPMLGRLAGVPMPAAWLYETAARWERELAAVQAVVEDPATTVRLVAEPGPAGADAVAETVTGLALYGLRTDLLLANRVLPDASADTWLAALRAQQDKTLAEWETAYGPGHGVRRVRHLGPNWYACVMGTAVVANAGAALPYRFTGLRTACTAVWALSLVLLAVLLAARAAHWAHHRDQARAHLLDPAVAPFYGCLSMALLAVGAGTLLVGEDWIGTGAALALDAVLFTLGTAIGLAAAVAVPYLMVVRHRVTADQASPVWLLPVVAPMVSAAVGPLLVPHLPAGQAQQTLLHACFAMFGLSLLATLVMLPVIFTRLVTTGPLPLALTPTLFLVLGPLGQSTTATGKLADVAPGVVPAPLAHGFLALAVLYGVPVMGFALFWLALAAALVRRARREGMRFAMTWWAFTFPVGTCVTGAEGLAEHTGLAAFDWLATGLFVLLLAACAVALANTLRGVLNGSLLAAPRRAPRAPAAAKARTT